MKSRVLTAVLALILTLPGCQMAVSPDNTPNEKVLTDESAPTAERNDNTVTEPYTRDTKIADVMSDPVFEGYGQLLFPTDDYYYGGETLGELRLVYYNNIDPDMTVKILNTLHDRAADGETIFYDIYTDEEKSADPDKEDTGLFFFKGEPGAKFAICNAGGAFAYVGVGRRIRNGGVRRGNIPETGGGHHAVHRTR